MLFSGDGPAEIQCNEAGTVTKHSLSDLLPPLSSGLRKKKKRRIIGALLTTRRCAPVQVAKTEHKIHRQSGQFRVWFMDSSERLEEQGIKTATHKAQHREGCGKEWLRGRWCGTVVIQRSSIHPTSKSTASQTSNIADYVWNFFVNQFMWEVSNYITCGTCVWHMYMSLGRHYVDSFVVVA